MIEHHTSASNFNDVMELIHKDVMEHKSLIITTKAAKVGKWGLARLWYMWMQTTGEYMASKGITMPFYIKSDGINSGNRPFNQNDAHELFTMRWMGTDENGTRLSWAKNSHDGMRAATKGERVDALRQHEEWCLEKGIILFTPRNSEYDELRNSDESRNHDE